MTNSSINYQSLSENSSELNKINNRKCNCKCNIWYILYVFLLFTYVNYDVIIVSHLLNESQIEDEIDPYYGDLVSKLVNSGISILLVL